MNAPARKSARLTPPDDFRMVCPNCSSTRVDLESAEGDRRASRFQDVVLACYTCGHRVYGEKRVQAECDRQYSAWEKARQEAARPAPVPAPPVKPAEVLDEPEADFDPWDGPELEPKPPKKPTPRAATYSAPPEPPFDPKKPACAGKGCKKNAKKGSKYCSRNCCVSMARARYTAKKQAEAKS